MRRIIRKGQFWRSSARNGLMKKVQKSACESSTIFRWTKHVKRQIHFFALPHQLETISGPIKSDSVFSNVTARWQNQIMAFWYQFLAREFSRLTRGNSNLFYLNCHKTLTNKRFLKLNVFTRHQKNTHSYKKIYLKDPRVQPLFSLDLFQSARNMTATKTEYLFFFFYSELNFQHLIWKNV